MGKITSMHFTGWKLGLKTGMYYLRTTAASAPIQFTVDQEQLKVVDTNVARTITKKRGIQSKASPNMSPAVPKPMYMSKTGSDAAVPADIPTPSTTPPPEPEAKRISATPKKESAMQVPAFKADQEEGESPKVLAEEGVNGLPDDELLEPTIKTKKQEEDADEDSKGREGDIYAEAVLACSIENPESCLMCSG